MKSHQKSWYKQYLNLSNYSSRQATFSASPSVSQQRRISGLEGPSATATLGHSFPQPEDVESDEGSREGGHSAGQPGHGSTGDGLQEETGRKSQNLRSPSKPAKPRPRPRQKTASTESDQGNRAQSFVTAPVRPSVPPKLGQSLPASSFVTAFETSDISPIHSHGSTKKGDAPIARGSPKKQRPPHNEGSSSTASLLGHSEDPATDSPTQASRPKPVTGTAEGEATTEAFVPPNENGAGEQISKPTAVCISWAAFDTFMFSKVSDAKKIFYGLLITQSRTLTIILIAWIDQIQSSWGDTQRVGRQIAK